MGLRPIDGRRRAADDVLGNRALTRFDYCIIGSGAGGASAAHVLTAAGKNVLVLEAGHNPYPGLDRPGPLPPTLHGSDELKYYVRSYLDQQALLEPRTFRQDDATEGTIENDVNLLPKVVGGAFQHSGAAVPRFNVVDFRLKSTVDRLIAARKPGLAFTLGAMGSRQHNFYNDAFRRAGYEDAAREVQHLWLDGRREEAAARVPDELVLKTNLLGTDAMVRARLAAYRAAGITTLRVEPAGEKLSARLETLGRLLDLVRALG